MRLIFHGQLKKLYGDSMTMQVSTVAEAIEGFSRQAPDWPREMLIDAIGFDTFEKLKESPDEVHLMPAMRGGGGKFGTILLGAAMIGLAFATGGASLAANGLVTTTFGASLLVTGGLMILQGVMNLFMKAPTVTTSADPEASKYISVNTNTTTVGTSMTMAWGRISLGGQWLSLQSNSSNLSFGVFPANPT